MSKRALIVIDVQKGLDASVHGERSTPEFESNLAKLLSHWRRSNYPVLHIQHCSVEKDSLLRPELPGNAFKDVAIPESGEQLVKKSTASAFVGTNLEELLHSLEISSLVIAGLTTDHCVSASARSASDLGFEVIVVSDATAAHERKAWDGNSYSAEDVHTLSLVALDGEFSDIRSTDEILRKSQDTETLP